MPGARATKHVHLPEQHVGVQGQSGSTAASSSSLAATEDVQNCSLRKEVLPTLQLLDTSSPLPGPRARLRHHLRIRLRRHPSHFFWFGDKCEKKALREEELVLPSAAETTTCSTLCQRTRSCGPDTAKSGSGRDPWAASNPTATSSQSTRCRLGRRMRPDRRRVDHLVILTLRSGHPLSPWRGVVLHLGQGRSDVQTFVPEELSDPSLPPSIGCRPVGSTNRRQHESFFLR